MVPNFTDKEEVCAYVKKKNQRKTKKPIYHRTVAK